MSTNEPFQEIYLCPAHSNIVAGVLIGSVAIAPALKPIDACTGAIVPGGLAEQARASLVNLDLFLDAAGLDRGNVARVTFFIQNLTYREAMNPVWEEWYPDPQDRAPHKYVEANLPQGTLVVAQAVAVAASGLSD